MWAMTNCEFSLPGLILNSVHNAIVETQHWDRLRSYSCVLAKIFNIKINV